MHAQCYIFKKQIKCNYKKTTKCVIATMFLSPNYDK